jgi:hypothetical protein
MPMMRSSGTNSPFSMNSLAANLKSARGNIGGKVRAQIFVPSCATSFHCRFHYVRRDSCETYLQSRLRTISVTTSKPWCLYPPIGTCFADTAPWPVARSFTFAVAHVTARATHYRVHVLRGTRTSHIRTYACSELTALAPLLAQ